VRVLFANHTGLVSGAERVLLTLLPALPDDIEPTVACPDGPLADEVGALGVPRVEVPETTASLRLHAVQTPLATAELLRGSRALQRAGAAADAQLVHANSIRAGLWAVTATGLRAPPAVVHVHDCLPRTRMADLTRRLIGRRAAIVIANSHFTGANFSAGGARAPIRVIHNPVDPQRFGHVELEPAEARDRLGLPADGPLLGVVAQLTAWKGHETAVEALALLRERHPDARLVIAGEAKFASAGTRFDNIAFTRRLHESVRRLGLEQSVIFLGDCGDVPALLRALDVLLVPSWEEPFGLVVIEAMAVGTPVIATSVGGPAEVIEDGRNGMLAPPQRPDLWAAGAGSILSNPRRHEEMARRGLETAARFDAHTFANEVVYAYDEALP
jgi:glycosyltransferase involved in cell wall biosynthesis